MSDIQRYKMAKAPSGAWFMADEHEKGKWVKYSEHKQEMEFKDKKIKVLGNNCHAVFEKSNDLQKAIESKEKEIAEDKTYISGLESIVKEQKKEIGRLKRELEDMTDAMNKYADDDD